MLSHFIGVQLFATLWTVAHQAPLSMGFPRQEYWSRLLFPLPGYLPDPGIEPVSLMTLHWQVGSLSLAPWESPPSVSKALPSPAVRLLQLMVMMVLVAHAVGSAGLPVPMPPHCVPTAALVHGFGCGRQLTVTQSPHRGGKAIKLGCLHLRTPVLYVKGCRSQTGAPWVGGGVQASV